MVLQFKQLILFMGLLPFFFSCKKEYSYERSTVDNGVAVFSFTGSPALCTNALVAGNYKVGVPFTATNTVSLLVNVGKVGNYVISTTTLNGILFTASGSFSDTGIQKVVLAGSGTPAIPGVFNFIPTGNGCQFSITVLATTNVDSSDIYYEATIDGVHYKQTVTENNGYEAGSSVSGNDYAISGSNISPSTQPIAPNHTQMAIIKGVLHNYLSISNENFKDFFNPGVYSWVVFGQEGVSLAWTDGNGVNWSTYNIPGTQNESNFTIISAENAPDLTGYYIKVKAKFNCKLYDVDGNIKTLSNGTYVGYFGKI